MVTNPALPKVYRGIRVVEYVLESIQARLRGTVTEGSRLRDGWKNWEEIGKLNGLGHQMQEAIKVSDRQAQSHDEGISGLREVSPPLNENKNREEVVFEVCRTMYDSGRGRRGVRERA